MSLFHVKAKCCCKRTLCGAWIVHSAGSSVREAARTGSPPLRRKTAINASIQATLGTTLIDRTARGRLDAARILADVCQRLQSCLAHCDTPDHVNCGHCGSAGQVQFRSSGGLSFTCSAVLTSHSGCPGRVIKFPPRVSFALSTPAGQSGSTPILQARLGSCHSDAMA